MQGYHAGSAANSSQVGGFRERTVRPIYDRSNLGKYTWPGLSRAGRSESLTVLNKFGPSGHGEAQVQYLDGDFRVISPGTYVRCAITDVRIPLDELKYWSVDLQEAYSVPDRRAATALSRRGEGPELVAFVRCLLSRALNRRAVDEFPQQRRIVEFQRHRERHDRRAQSGSCRRAAAAPDPFPSSPASAPSRLASAIRPSISPCENG